MVVRLGQDVDMTRKFMASLSILAFLVAACGNSSTDDSVQSTTTKLTLLPTTTTTLPPVTTTTEPPPETTTTVATTSTTSTVVATTEVPAESVPSLDVLELSADGIGPAGFSAEPEGIISYLTSLIGPPTADTGWVDPFTIGPCSGTELRLVSWGVLTLTFGDFSQVVEGRRHFFAFSYGLDGQAPGQPAGIETAEGVTIGSSLVDLLAAYPTAVLNPSDDFTPPSFVINNNFRGFLTGLADDSTVSVIFGGQGCGE